MLFTQVKGRKVVNTATAATVGHVADLLVDARGHRLAAMVLSGAGQTDTVMWDGITAFGADAVTLPSEDVLVQAPEASEELATANHDLLGKRLLTTTGRELGTVTDLEFDQSTGTVTTLTTTTGDIPGSRLVDVGSYAAIVRPA